MSEPHAPGVGHASMLDFTLLQAGALAPRLGRVALAGRKPVVTPAFIANTSRGVIPHVSQDNFGQSVGVHGVYMALEDFVEKHPHQTPPIFSHQGPDALRRFVALPQHTLLVLGARRNPPMASPVANTNTDVSLFTSVGFTSISSAYYAAAALRLQPDVVVGMADMPFGQEHVGRKRQVKMSDRTAAWLEDLVAARAPRVFAPVLPIAPDLQACYLQRLLADMGDRISGLAIYDAGLLAHLPAQLQHLPRLSLHPPASPHDLLRHVALGMDLCTVPFVAEATDAGIVLDFAFPPPPKHPSPSRRRALGIDMWSEAHAVSVIPLSEGCACYACTKHHRAYLQHLLAAKEMLGWVLIQLHNHAVLSTFFAGIRASIEAGTFETDVAAFAACYHPALPAKTGQGPRVRGYQFKSEAHATKHKKNPKAFRKFGEDEIATLRAAHAQQPGEKPATRDVMDDEALFGLAGMDVAHPDGNMVAQVDHLELEDDDKA